MLSALIGAALRQRALTLALALIVAGLGLRAGLNAPFDVFPEFAPPMIEIQTEVPGLSAEDVEALVTIPVETLVSGAPGLATLRSKSVLGLSSVVLLLRQDADAPRARQIVQERLTTAAARLPAVARPPVLLPPLSATSRVLKIGLTSQTLDVMTLSERLRWTIRPRLMAVPGVANVAVWGARDRQLQVRVDPVRLAAANLTFADAQRAATDTVAAAGGGFIDGANQRIAVRQAVGVAEAADLADAVIRVVDGLPVRIGDVAEVGDGVAQPIGSAIVNGRPGLLLIVEKLAGANTLDVTRGVDAALAELAPALPGVEIDAAIFRPARFIDAALGNLREALVLGCLLVAAMLLVFTRDLRAAAISLTAIPLSLLAAVLVLRAFGTGIDTMVVAGLVIALGEIVDDAIVDVENIGRRLRDNAGLPEPRPALAVVLSASLEVRAAVVFASLIVVLVFVPVFFLDGVAGSFFRPLALAYVAAIGASLLVALTVTPALALVFAPDRSGHREPAWIVALRARYLRLLDGLLPRARLAQGLAAGGLAAALLGFALLPQAFLPEFRERDFLMHFVGRPGASPEAMERITTNAARELLAIPGVRSFGAHIGRAEQGDEVYGPNFTELWVSLDDRIDHDTSVAHIESVIAGYQGLQRDVLTYLRERIKEVLAGAGATVVVRLYGPELATLRTLAATVRDALDGLPGVEHLKIEPQALVPQLLMTPRAEALAVAGLSSGELRRLVAATVGGARVGEIYRDQKSFEVAIRGAPDAATDPGALARLLVTTPGGALQRLGDLAELRIAPAVSEVKRENGSRRLDVSLQLARGADLGAVAQEVERRVRALPMPVGHYPRFLGEWAALEASRTRLATLSVLALAGVLFVVWLAFRSARLVLLLAASLPFALLGGVAAIALGGGALSLGALVGFVTVLGISARNGLLLLSHFRHLEREDGLAFGPEMVRRGAAERLVPILMTAGCAALALLPLVVRGAVPGQEIEHPMALVILGGLVTSTALNLLLMPALYLRHGRTAVP